jgi:LysR family transcriptional regulator, transcription activator of glutamate synthase operon
MELRQLRYVVALAEERSFTRAASKVLVAQPALSQQIAKLEAELGVSLADRTTRRVGMTEAGDRLVDHARRILRQVDVAAEDLAAMAGVRAGRLTIGASRTVGSFDLSSLIAEFHGRYPEIDLAVREDLSASLAAELQADDIDLAFITRPAGPDDEGLALRVVSKEPLVAILAPGHPLARRRRLRVPLLEGERIVTFREGATIRKRLEDAAARAGYVPHVAFETNEVGRMRALAAAGLAIAVLPRSDAELPGAPITAVPFQEPEFEHTVYIASRAGRHHSPAARAFMELVLSEHSPAGSSTGAEP